ncbi:putative ribonuclease H-like domain-containing protein, partial [Tanacetum coccineum]
DWVSDNEEDDVPQAKIEKKTAKPSFIKIDFVKTKQTNKTNRKTAKQNIVPKVVLMKSGLVSVNTARQVDDAHTKTTVNAARPMVAERKNRTLIEAARTMLADSKLPTTFWGEAVNTAYYVQNRVLVTKPHNKTPYELFLGRKPALGFMRPFGCLVTILNTIDHLGKFDGKADEGFFVGYSINSKAFRVFNSITRIVEENLHVQFIVAGNHSNGNAGTKACDDTGKARMETVPSKDYHLLPLWPADLLFSQSLKSSLDDGFKPSRDDENKVTEEPRKEGGDSSKEDESDEQEKDDNVNNTNNVNTTSDRNSTNNVNAVSSTVYDVSIEVYAVGAKISIELSDDLNMLALEDIVYSDDDEDVGAEADMNNLDAFLPVSPIPTTRDELLRFKLQKVWTLEDLPNGKMAIGTKWVQEMKRLQVNEKEMDFYQSRQVYDWEFEEFGFTDLYLKGQPKLGLWYPKDSPFDLVAYTDSDYAGASLDMKSTIGEAEYVAASSCCGQVLWIQNQLLDYGYNFMHTKFYIDNKSTICIVKNPVFHSKTKHIEIRHHFIRDSNKKKLIQMIKIHTNKNVTDLLTKAFDNGIGVNVGDSKLMLLGINLLLLGKVNVARHKLTIAVESKNYEWGSTITSLVDRKKVIVTKASIRRDLQLDDESAKTTARNEFSSTMASTIICLATNQKFNFSKYIFESMVKNLNNVGKFLMYPRFVQVFLDNQLEEMETHNRTYIAPSHTKNIFANMRRQGKDFSGRVTPLFPTMVVQAQEEMGEGLAMPTDPHHTPIITQPQRKQKSRRPKRKDTEIPQSSGPIDTIVDEAVNEEMDDSLERAVTTATSLDAEQDRGNISKTQSKATPNEPSSLRTSSGGVNTPQSNELMDFCTQLQQRVLDLENTKTAQAQEITSLKLRVKRLEKKGGSRTHKLKRLYKIGRSARVVSFDEASLGYQEDASKQGRKIADIDKDAEITLVDETQGSKVAAMKKDYEVNVVKEVVSVAEETVNAATITEDEITLAQALAELKSVKLKVTTATTTSTKGILLQEPSESTPTRSLQLPSQVKSQGTKDKGKAKIIEPEKPLKKKDQIKFDEEEALRLQAEFDEEDRLAREKVQQVEEANIAWDDIQAKIDADYQLVDRLQAQEQQELTIEEKSTLFQQILEKIRKFFAAKRAEEKRNRPPTRAQKRSIMCTYLKNMAGWKPKDLKNKSFVNI